MNEISNFAQPANVQGIERLIASRSGENVVINSVPPRSLWPGGMAGHVLEGELRAQVGGSIFAGNVGDFNEFLGRLLEIKKANGGLPLGEITIFAHGAAGEVIFANGRSYFVGAILKHLTERGLLRRGGKLILAGCNIARDENNLKIKNYIQKQANEYGIHIRAVDHLNAANLDALIYLEFSPGQSQPRRCINIKGGLCW